MFSGSCILVNRIVAIRERSLAFTLLEFGFDVQIALGLVPVNPGLVDKLLLYDAITPLSPHSFSLV